MIRKSWRWHTLNLRKDRLSVVVPHKGDGRVLAFQWAMLLSSLRGAGTPDSATRRRSGAAAWAIAWTALASVACGGVAASSGSSGADQSHSTPDADTGRAANDAETNDTGSGATAQDSGSGACVLVATNYDQSCAVDSDCVEVTGGNYCSGPQCMCGGSAINAGALAQFHADAARVHDGGDGPACPCPAPLGPCCRSGTCATECWSPTDTLPACAGAGGSCAPPNAGCGSVGGAPRVFDGGCAFPDEMCCL